MQPNNFTLFVEINFSNYLISVCESKEKNNFIILCAIDNLIKGGSGQAIQNFNLMFNLNKKMGLKWGIS